MQQEPLLAIVRDFAPLLFLLIPHAACVLVHLVDVVRQQGDERIFVLGAQLPELIHRDFRWRWDSGELLVRTENLARLIARGDDDRARRSGFRWLSLAGALVITAKEKGEQTFVRLLRLGDL